MPIASTKEPVSRRRALALLGLAGAGAYVAPTLLSVTQARASGGSRGSGGGRRGSSRRSRGS